MPKPLYQNPTRPPAERPTDLRLEDKLAQAAQLIHNAQALIIAAGAGMGVDSGLPDFRSDNGFWRTYPALAQSRLRFEEAATAGHFIQHPERAWGFYGHRLQKYRTVQPHAGFGLLKAWGEAAPGGYFVYTSNVDGQFQQAGFAAERIYECHGSLHGLQCSGDCEGKIWSAAGFVPDVDEAHCLLRNALPRCPGCGGIARPNVLMFDDGAWNSQRSDQQHERLTRWLETLGPKKNGTVVVVEVGAGRALPAVRAFSQRLQSQGAALIRINLNEADVQKTGHIELALGAKEALERIQCYLQASTQA